MFTVGGAMRKTRPTDSDITASDKTDYLAEEILTKMMGTFGSTGNDEGASLSGMDQITRS